MTIFVASKICVCEVIIINKVGLVLS